MNIQPRSVTADATQAPPARGAATTAPSVTKSPVTKPPSVTKSWLRAIEITSRIETEPRRLLASVIDEWAAAAPQRDAIVSDRESFSYAALADRIDRYARWALTNGIGIGDVVCVLMPNRPDYLAAWLGITKVGGVAALINTQLVGASLAHCIEVAQPKHVIVADELAEAFASARPHLAQAPRVWTHGGAGADSIDQALAALDAGPLAPHERREVSIEHLALLIYTSGTTGLPKAARVTHRRVMSWAGWFAGLTDAGPGDRMYNCLPIYHSVGGVVAPGSLLMAGGSVVIAEKFSASRFWDDIARWDCTLFQYIGELCRYLLQAPPRARDTQHRLRLACGNGLRGDVWEAFQARFAIPRILEFYASTEGNFSLYNVEGRPGAIGRVPSFLAHRFPAAIVKFDLDSGLPLRGDDGLCVRCARNEPGEAIGRIGDAADRGGRFEGYTSDAASDTKVLRDVFARGDAWYRTGDLMRLDDQGFFHFVDRIGDTFRWKGENVAASEVAEAIAACPGVTDVSVYGVSVPQHDGRAGMAALVVDARFDIDALHRHLADRLPSYARPLFLRLRPALEITGTFKQNKQDLIRDGFDPGVVSDPLYVGGAQAARYVALDEDLHRRIAAGELRL
ncbi:AMP-dependent synthetase and ligase [Rhodopseudomonas palustris HaA2]|uniref:AMP-dependent synthetase and ligase n=1 Tax=Rhodopseudomonas palustris (strain HaA2) TaxID=316058 RepID=Q2J1F0_RHOP2|nr:long-chain-acyl-CoA synthetase [Rhodopseudomonas palustris]ABD05710.1 AMP-dependent synthetase and ligase [Rhodopseudomonas palustris HaA2]